MNKEEENFEALKKAVLREKKIAGEISAVFSVIAKSRDNHEKKMMTSQIDSLKDALKKTNDELSEIMEGIFLARPLKEEIKLDKESTSAREEITWQKKEKPKKQKFLSIFKNKGLSEFERSTLKRIKKREKREIVEKEKKPSRYFNIANKLFSEYSSRMIGMEMFKSLKEDLVKSSLQILPKTYISLMILSTIISFFVAACIFIFFTYFDIVARIPFVALSGDSFFSRIAKTIWIPVLLPISTFLFIYFYPYMEKKSAERRIEQELPFATIHMAAISGSMIEPSKIFSIIASTKEYPFVGKELVKLMNEINILGYDLVSALRNRAFSSPSKKLSELFNGIATTISSGGNLPEFFEKRAQTLLFDYKIEREKYTRSAETFMDIYISVVIASPMVFMLLLIMMKISGFGISLSTSMISLIMVLGVSVVNFFFLVFLQLKQPS